MNLVLHPPAGATIMGFARRSWMSANPPAITCGFPIKYCGAKKKWRDKNKAINLHLIMFSVQNFFSHKLVFVCKFFFNEVWSFPLAICIACFTFTFLSPGYATKAVGISFFVRFTIQSNISDLNISWYRYASNICSLWTMHSFITYFVVSRVQKAPWRHKTQTEI